MNDLRKAVFLDRDGVINKERKDYVKSVSELEIFSGIVEPIKHLKNNGFLIIVITNQSAINRNLTTHEKIFEVHNEIQSFFMKNAISIDDFYYCPHRPDENCDCRKPKPGLLLEAAKKWKIDLKSSWMIGDSDTDMEAASAAGCKSLTIRSSIELGSVVTRILNSLD